MSEAPKRVRLFRVTSGDKRDFYVSMIPCEASNPQNDSKASEWISAAALRELCEELRFASQNVPDIPSEEFGNGAKLAYEVVAGMIKALLEGK